MAGLDDFKQSITEMSDDELDEILDNTRNDRVRRSAPKEEKSGGSGGTKKETDTSSPSPSSLDDIEDMTPEQAREFLESLK